MKMKKRILAGALAGVMFLGVGGFTMLQTTTVAEAAQESYNDGTTNEFSHRMKQEGTKHEQNVRSIRYEYRQDGDQKKYDRNLEKEQKRHDKEMRDIRADYDSHARHEARHKR